MFTAALRQGAKLADNLFDDVAIQAKHVDEVFDETAWLKDNPRPHPDVKTREMSPEQTRDYNNWKARKHAAKNRQRLREKNAKWRAENPEKQAQSGKNWRDKNKERVRETNQNYYKNNKDQEKDRARRWAENNPDRKRANNATRRAARINRTPAWADPDRIDEIYRTAAEVSAETGIPHHVDHVMPLQGSNVSGLHHQDNLLIVPGPENLSKGNIFEPGDLPPRAGVRKSRAYLKKIREAKEKAKR